MWRAEGWYIAENSPDYFNACCTDAFAGIGVPMNDWGYRYAASGSAYCGFATYLSWEFYREKLGIQLVTPLTIGVRYYLSFKVSSVSNIQPVFENGATNKIGALFSTIQYDLNHPPPTNNYCQIWTDSIITDTIGWVLIKDSFIADSAYNYMTLGNFFDDTHTDTLSYWHWQGNYALRAYYFIDDVCLSEDSVGCIFNDAVVPITNPELFTAFPNPVSNNLNIYSGLNSEHMISFYSFSGNLIYETATTSNQSLIDVSQFPSGLYFLKLKTENKILTTKISITH